MKQKRFLAMAVIAAMMACMLMGCSLQKTAVERAENVIETYKTGDIGKFKSYIEDDDRLHYMLDALDDSNATGMVEVYQKVYELTKNVEYTVVEKENDASHDYAVVTLKTVDFTNALYDAMYAAAAESGEAFADVPTWMMEALNTGGEPVELEVEVRTKNMGALFEGYNKDFLSALTGGFYEWIMSTMTTCEANNEYNDRTYMLATYDTVNASLDDYELSFEGMEYTDEEVDAIIYELTNEYGGYDGIVVGGNRVEGGLRIYMLIDYDMASFRTLERLELASGGNTDSVGLSVSVKGLESDGYVCETTDFGSGVLSDKE